MRQFLSGSLTGRLAYLKEILLKIDPAMAEHHLYDKVWLSDPQRVTWPRKCKEAQSSAKKGDDDAMRDAAAVLKQTKNSNEVKMRSSNPPLIFFHFSEPHHCRDC